LTGPTVLALRTRRAGEARRVDAHALAVARQQFEGLLGPVTATEKIFASATAPPGISGLRMRTGAAGRRPLEMLAVAPLTATA
jgi:hypothetical protein